jgi:hypothetical protein
MIEPKPNSRGCAGAGAAAAVSLPLDGLAPQASTVSAAERAVKVVAKSPSQHRRAKRVREDGERERKAKRGKESR